MKLTCDRDSLLQACQAVAPAVASHTTIPVLKNIKATALDDTLTLVAYDPTQGIGIRYEMRGVDVTVPGSCILAKDQLVAALRESAESSVTITAGQQPMGLDLILVNCGWKYELPVMNPDEFPLVPEFGDDGVEHQVSAGALRALIKRTVFAADKRDTSAKFACTGVLWQASEGRVRLSATDTKRWATCEASGETTRVEGVQPAHIVPLKAVQLLERSLGDDGETVRVSLRPNDALFQTERAVIYTALVQGKFPPGKDIIAKSKRETTQTITLPVAGFLAAVKATAVMVDEESMRVDMVFGPGQVAMTARGAKTGASAGVMKLPGHEGPLTEIAFDPHYLIEFLRALGDEKGVVLSMSTGERAGLFTCGEATSYLLMPLTG